MNVLCPSRSRDDRVLTRAGAMLGGGIATNACADDVDGDAMLGQTNPGVEVLLGGCSRERIWSRLRDLKWIEVALTNKHAEILDDERVRSALRAA